MKIRILFTLALALSLSAHATAASKKKTSKKAAKEVKAEAAKPDTVSTKDFSFAMGAAQTKGLKTFLQINAGIDTAQYMNDFIRGLKDMASKLEDPSMKAYAMGTQIAQQVFLDFSKRLNQEITGKDTTFIDLELYKKGFIAALENKDLPYTTDSAGHIVEKQMAFYHKERLEKEFGQNRKDGEDFLAENAKLKDVKTTASGLQYKVITQGNGPIPAKDATVKVNYKGTLIDGTVFDTTEGKSPFQTNVNHVIKGWTEALTMMPVGSKWEVYIPYQLAYGEREAGKIKPFSALIFTIELLEIVDTTQAAKKK